jgi:hypothetical protein
LYDTRTKWRSDEVVFVQVSSDDGVHLDMRDELTPMRAPATELARFLAAEPQFRTLAGKGPGRPVVLLLPDTFTPAAAGKVLAAVSAGLRERGFYRTVHALIGSTLLDNGSMTVPSWSRTLVPGPLQPHEVRMHKSEDLAGNVAIHFPSDVADLVADTRFLLNTDLGGPKLYKSLVGSEGDGTTLRLQPESGRLASIFGHGMPPSGYLQLEGFGDEMPVQGDVFHDLIDEAYDMAALYPPDRYDGFLFVMCNVGANWPGGPIAEFARRRRRAGDHRPVWVASDTVYVRQNGDLEVRANGIYRAYDADTSLPPTPPLGPVTTDLDLENIDADLVESLAAPADGGWDDESATARDEALSAPDPDPVSGAGPDAEPHPERSAMSVPLSKEYYGTFGLVFPSPAQDLLSRAGDWAQETSGYAMSTYGTTTQSWGLDEPLPPWGHDLPFTVLAGSHDGENLTFFGRLDGSLELHRPVADLADELAGTPEFREYLQNKADGSVLVVLPDTFDDESAGRALTELSARFRELGVSHLVHAVRGSMPLPQGRLTVPSWTGTA